MNAQVFFRIALLILFIQLTGVSAHAHLPGPNYVYQCTKCGNPIQKESNKSGNTLGAKLYSDNKMIARMLPDYPVVTKCPSCNTFLSFIGVKPIGQYYEGDRDCKPEWENAPYASFLGLDDLWKALKSTIALKSDNETRIRVEIWWGYNDKIRDDSTKTLNKADELLWTENCKALIPLMKLLDDGKAGKKFLLAELYRNLADYKQAIKILDTIEDSDRGKDVALQIRKECEKKNKWVIRLR